VIITSEKPLNKAKVMDKSKFVRNLESESSELRRKGLHRVIRELNVPTTPSSSSSYYPVSPFTIFEPVHMISYCTRVFFFGVLDIFPDEELLLSTHANGERGIY